MSNPININMDITKDALGNLMLAQVVHLSRIKELEQQVEALENMLSKNTNKKAVEAE